MFVHSFNLTIITFLHFINNFNREQIGRKSAFRQENQFDASHILIKTKTVCVHESKGWVDSRRLHSQDLPPSQDLSPYSCNNITDQIQAYFISNNNNNNNGWSIFSRRSCLANDKRYKPQYINHDVCDFYFFGRIKRASKIFQ